MRVVSRARTTDVMRGARAAMVGWAEIRGCARISDALVLARDDVVESRFVVLSDSEDDGCHFKETNLV